MTDDEVQKLHNAIGSITDEDRSRTEPPAELWEKIDTAVTPEAAAPTTDDRSPTTAAPVGAAPVDIASAARSRPQSRRPQLFRAAIAAAVVLIVALVSIAFLDGPDFDTFVAEASNSGLSEPFDGTANAVVEVDDSPTLDLEFSRAIPGEEAVELWLATPDGSDAVSLGTIAEGTTSWSGDWPSALNPVDYPVVALSLEPDDGDPAPSGRVFLVGELRQI